MLAVWFTSCIEEVLLSMHFSFGSVLRAYEQCGAGSLAAQQIPARSLPCQLPLWRSCCLLVFASCKPPGSCFVLQLCCAPRDSRAQFSPGPPTSSTCGQEPRPPQTDASFPLPAPCACPSRGENSVHEAQGHLPIRKSCLQQCLWVEARKNCFWGLSCWLAVRAGPNS